MRGLRVLRAPAGPPSALYKSAVSAEVRPFCVRVQEEPEHLGSLQLVASVPRGIVNDPENGGQRGKGCVVDCFACCFLGEIHTSDLRVRSMLTSWG